MTRLQALGRPITLGHALLLALAVVLLALTVDYAVLVRQADDSAQSCFFNNAKWLVTARKDLSDSVGERVMALDTAASELERQEHQLRSRAALQATAGILLFSSRPPVAITYSATGRPQFRAPPIATRWAYCHHRFPRPWPL